MNTRSSTLVLAVALASVGFLTSASAGPYVVGPPFKIAASPGAQRTPATYGGVVVWEENSLGQTCIKGWNLTAGEEVVVPHHGPQTCPAIWGDIVVWEDARSGNPDIYGYNLSTKQELLIAGSTSAERAPSIWGDWVVWEQSGALDTDIHAFNLTTQESVTVCSHSGQQVAPKIWDNWIVWQDLRSGAVDLYGFNLATRQEAPLVTGPGERGAHGLANGVLAWETINQFGESDISAMCLPNGTPWQVCNDPGYQFIPAVWGDLIVWGDWQEGVVGIRAYDTKTKEYLWALSPDAECTSLLSLAISGNLMVWEDASNWNSEVYGAYVSETPEPASLTALALGAIGLLGIGKLRGRKRQT